MELEGALDRQLYHHGDEVGTFFKIISYFELFILSYLF